MSFHESAALNAQALAAELEWFARMLNNCLLELGLREGEKEEETLPVLPKGAWYSEFVQHHALGGAERLVLVLALLPHIRPELLNELLRRETCKKHFGGIQGKVFPGMLPTVQTALTLLGGQSLFYQLAGWELFAPESVLLREAIVQLGFRPPEEPPAAAPLLVDEDALSRICRGQPHEPSGEEFPAHRLSTRLEWEDLVLPPFVGRQLQDILDWAERGDKLSWVLGMGKHVRPGYKALFYGPPGTGKTLTAALIGKRTGLPVYRVDLSRVVSKYIGETQKNLEQLFRRAENKAWILFFDEADALFNKRTEVESANDRHANQETAYLLQRLENHPNLTLMATNMLTNIDAAFIRRFNSGVFFPMPGKDERLRLWKACLGDKLKLTEEAMALLSEQELSGGQIANIALRLGLWALRQGSLEVTAEALKRAVQLDLVLQGKS